jgi:succinate dehydrogenase/fumarate reductase cytochrome b subunit
MMEAREQDIERKLFTAQVISGVLFSLFLTVHLINQMLASLGPKVYDETQISLRAWYQSPLLEILVVLAPMLIHATAGVWRMLRRRAHGKASPTSLRARLHRISGIVLLIFFIGHVTATRGASVFFSVFPQFAGIAFTLRWMPLYFWPYYTAFGLAALYHTAYGLSVALPVLGISRASWLRRPLVLGLLFSVGGVLLLLGLFAFGGLLFDVGCPEQSAYAHLLERLGFLTLDTSRCH